MNYTKNHIFINRTSAENYLKSYAKEKGIENFLIDSGSNKNQDDVMLLIELNKDKEPVRTIKTVLV